ncbi:hypothetical protein Spb1_39250 [Planctopirus ephydatiae]|uniref:Uncharacterized protein n=2 Tax=Planctopirus ephydatiae TaxID=2528019 RepID=A0A518GTR1_9PLAN|nr:hypothetical protein Spb1_39250 [Planctopirus ephydatiae]
MGLIKGFGRRLPLILMMICVYLSTSHTLRAEDHDFPESLSAESLLEWWQLTPMPEQCNYSVRIKQKMSGGSSDTDSTMQVLSSPKHQLFESSAPRAAARIDTTMKIRNPYYAAILKRINQDRWVLERLATDVASENQVVNTTHRTPPNLGYAEFVRNQLKTPGIAVEEVMSEAWQGETVRVLDVTFPRIPPADDKAEVDSFLRRMRIYISSSVQNFPVKLDFETEMGSGENLRINKRTIAYSDWVELDGAKFPKKFESWNLTPASSYDSLGQIVTVDISNWDAPFPQEQAYLTYYGLPEPEGISRGMSWWWWVVIVALGLGVFFFWRKLRA